MRLPNQFPHDAGLKVVYVTDNGYKEAGSKQGRQQPDGTARLHDPIRGPYFDVKQTQNNIKLKHPSQSACETMDAPPDNGTMGLCFGTTGDPNMTLAFVFDNMNNSQSVAGNFSLTNLPAITQAVNDLMGKLVSQGYKETTRDGTKVREPKDGQEWMFQLSQGLPIHAVINGLNGTVIPNLQQIETAIQQFGMGMSQNILSQLPGQLMSLTSLFNQMSSSQKSQVKENMPPEVANAFESMIYLQQSPDDSTSDADMEGRVNTEVFMASAVNMLSNVRTLEDLERTFVELNSNNIVRGVNTLPRVKVNSETMHGTVTLNVDAEGNIAIDGYENSPNIMFDIFYVDDANLESLIVTSNTATSGAGSGGGGGGGNQNILQAIQKFASLLSNGMQNTGTSFNDNMWKDQAKKMAEVMGRVSNGSKWKAQAQMGAGMNSLLGPTPQWTKNNNIVEVGSKINKWFA